MADRHGRIDLFYDNAGIAVAGGIEELTPPHWDSAIDVNLRGVIHGVEAVYPVMRAQGHGHIVITASLAGLIPVPLLGPYTVTKHAVVALARVLRLEAAASGVKVTAVCPAFVDTPLLDNINPGSRADRGQPGGGRPGASRAGPADPARSRSPPSCSPRCPATPRSSWRRGCSAGWGRWRSAWPRASCAGSAPVEIGRYRRLGQGRR